MERLTITVEDFCRGFGIGRTKAYELIGDGELEIPKVGRRTLVTKRSVNSFIERSRVRGGCGREALIG